MFDFLENKALKKETFFAFDSSFRNDFKNSKRLYYQLRDTLYVQGGPKVSSHLFLFNKTSKCKKTLILLILNRIKNYGFILVGSDFWLTLYTWKLEEEKRCRSKGNFQSMERKKRGLSFRGRCVADGANLTRFR